MASRFRTSELVQKAELEKVEEVMKKPSKIVN